MNSEEPKVAVNKRQKDTMFRFLYKDKKNLLELYNGLNDSDYTDAEQLEIVTLESAIYMSMKNDVAFVLDHRLHLYEHQSTYSPNIPLRNLIYLVNLLQKLINKKDLYGSRLIKIPTPHFAVFYNGTENRPEVEELRLSTAFEHTMDSPEIELHCKVYNINKGNNVELLRRCPVLRDYMYFVDKVRFYIGQLGDLPEELEEAIELAIDDCINNHVLEDFMKSRRSEVVKVTQLDYTHERRMKLVQQEEYEHGLQQGIQNGLDVAFHVIAKLNSGVTPEELIAQGTDEHIVRQAMQSLGQP